MTDINRIVRKQTDQHDSERHTDPVKITNQAVNPFNEWSDWYAEDGEAVITFITMKHHLFEEWRSQAQHINITKDLATKNGKPVDEEDTVTLYTHRSFENDFDGPGIYQDDTHYEDDDKVDESYTIILPESFMTREMCEKYLEKLNNEYNREFYFEDEDYKQKRAEFTKAQIEDDDDIEVEGMTTQDVKKLMDHMIY